MGVDGCCEGSTVALTTDQTQMQVERASRPDLLHYCIGFPHWLSLITWRLSSQWEKGGEIKG